MSEDFKILDEREHILVRPSMYIGSTSLESYHEFIDGKQVELQIVPALLKIINEIIDNSTDEFIRTKGKFANKIDISINQDPLFKNQIQVKDNGRGIPVEKTDGEFRPVLAWTRARAGSNFSDDDNRVTMGMNGVGSFVTNVFSKWFCGYTCDGKKHITVECKNNGMVNHVKTGNGKTQGTSVSFIPDLERLGGLDEVTDDHVKVLKNRLQNLTVCFPGIQFTLNGEKIKFKNIKDVASQYGTALSYDFGGIKTFIANSGDEQEFRLVSYVNGLNIKNGGSHVDYIMNGIIDHLRPAVKKKHKIDVLPAQIKQHILLGVYAIDFKNLKFDSQTKERITNSKAEIETHISGSVDFAKIAKQILATEDIIMPIIDAILAKKEFAERMALAKKNKQAKRAKVAKHIAATSKNPMDRTIFITEGNSAINSLISVRDPVTIGGYPLKGKVMNTSGRKASEIVQNKELFELMAVLGLELGSTAPDLNYGNICILADADVDGYAIACLLINFLARWPVLFDEGRVHMVKTPKYIAKKGKNTKMFYSTEEYKAASLAGWEVDYIKGLGTLPREAYKEVINSPRLITVSKIEVEDSKSLVMAFGSDSQLRKEWLK